MADNFSHLLPPSSKLVVNEWLQADIPKFDAGGFVVGEGQATASILGKSPGVIAGIPFAEAVFDHLGCTVEWLAADGDVITTAQAERKAVVGRVTGPARMLLLGERTALNILARASGIATQARAVMSLVKARKWHGSVAATRKTTPGFGLVEKYAVLVGGATPHRMDLSNMVMLKDNHIWSTGSITASVHKARRAVGHATKIEVECRNLDEAFEAAAAGAEIVMLDNYTPDDLKQDARTFKQRYPHVVVEASGGITVDTIGAYLSPHVDVVSQGSLTQGYDTLDFSMKLPRPAAFAATSKL
eukprot:CAMPEP_0205822880 /NCGR_PEP_ID=MMETSP0206-20130828/14433_1 /ASSEMBLY_ACC=CAM_ASM_000279 /TAXON_ID=36767 /ORGANISM="Euplotes focardii, Strain TN1" /LENGTH=300 /DNA_ID=CAMNT_0053119531 /DNA_START=23 /DNA_END=925 /DNA_ORIENTATION=+